MTGINFTGILQNEAIRPDYQRESGEIFNTNNRLQLIFKLYAWIYDNGNKYLVLGINGPYKHAISVVGVLFILITIAVAYIIYRKRSERGKNE